MTTGRDTGTQTEQPTVRTGRSWSSAAPELPQQDRLGRYELGTLVGSGGMGVVVAAWDPELDREVAIKVVRPDISAQAGASLLQEARAVARLSDPHVVPVYDVGIVGDQVFMAMELVEGETLARWLDQPRGYTEILDCFRQAGRGLAAAHEAGISHRDFKPSNVLVGNDGRVRVMDFGIASVADPNRGKTFAPQLRGDLSGSTTGVSDGSDAIVGTPVYMPPEQMLGERVTPQSDQFSFCVGLWKALYGTYPFEGASDHRRLDAIESQRFTAHHDPLGVPSRVERVLRRGLRAHPEQRFDDMPALLGALDAAARPRSRRWLSLAGLGVVIGVAAVPWGSDESSVCDNLGADFDATWTAEARGGVRRALEAARTEEAGIRSIESDLDEFANRWTATRAAVCEDENAIDGSTDAAIACLARGQVAFASAFELIGSGDADALQHAHRIVQGLPDVQVCGQPQALARKTPRPSDAKQAMGADEVRQLLRQANSARATGRFDDAIERAREAAKRAKKIGYEPVVAEAWHVLGNAQMEAGEYDDARSSLLEAWDTAVASRHDQIAVAAAADLIYHFAFHLSDLDSAEEWIPHAQVALQRWGHGTFEESHVLMNIGTQRALQGRAKEALEAYQAALAIRERLFDRSDAHVQNTLANVAHALSMLDRFDEALELDQELLANRRERYGEMHPEVANAYSAMGNALWYSGQPGPAAEAYREALRILDATVAENHPSKATPLANLAGVLSVLGENEQAVDVYLRALDLAREAFPSQHRRRATMVNNLGVVYLELGKTELAREQFKLARDLFERASGEDHPDLAAPLTNLGKLALSDGRLDDAQQLCDRALKLKTAALGPNHPSLARTALLAGQILEARGELEQAREVYEHVVEIGAAAAQDDTGHPIEASGAERLAAVLSELGDDDGAIAAASRSLQIREDLELGPLDLASSEFTLARVLRGRDSERARALARHALAAYADAGPALRGEAETIEQFIAQP